MTPEQAEDAVKAARTALTEFADVRRDLPNRVRAARTLGISRAEIARLATISRTTVDRYLNADWVQRELDRARPKGDSDG